MHRIAAEEVGERMMKQGRTFRELLSQTPVDQLQVREHPVVLFRVSEYTWLDAIVRCVVRAKEAGRVYIHLIMNLVVAMKAEPFFFSSRRRHTRLQGDWSSDVCSSD